MLFNVKLVQLGIFWAKSKELVRQGYGASKEDALVTLPYDVYYIKHQSLWLDIIILLKTIIDTLTFRGRA